MSRHGRQSRLVEVGSAGQQRIAASTVEVSVEGLAAEVATRYLVGAGLGCVRVHDSGLVAVAASIDPSVRVEVVARAARAGTSTAAARDFDDPAAAEVGRGAREALRILRDVLGVAS